MIDSRDNAPWDQPEKECYECGKPHDNKDNYCSNACFRASMI